MALNPAQAQTAQLIYTLAKQRGLPDNRAREMVAAAYAESGLNPAIRNKSSGATGLFQLLSSGYVNKANALGGTTNPRANFQAIAPDYVSYWRSHPNAAPGEAAAAVERSGEGAGFYSSPLSQIGALGAARSPGVDSLTSLGLSSSASAPATATPPGGPQGAPMQDPSLRRAFAMQLIAANQAGGHGRSVDYSPVLQALTALRTKPLQTPAPAASGGAVDSQPMNAAPLPAAATPTPGGKVTFLGNTAGVKPHLLAAVSQAAAAAGATQVRVTSGYRDPAHNAAVGGVTRSNHMTGDAIDAEAYIPGQGWVPLGTLLRATAGRYGLRSGDQPGFYRGNPDPVHVDDAANQR